MHKAISLGEENEEAEKKLMMMLMERKICMNLSNWRINFCITKKNVKINKNSNNKKKNK